MSFENLDPCLARALEEAVIEGSTVPLAIGDKIVRGCRDRQALDRRRTASTMAVEGKAPLQPSRKTRHVAQPATMRGKRVEIFQFVPESNAFESQIGERRRRLSQGKPRMTIAFHHDHTASCSRQQPGK